jgi:3-oxoacyl-[acyl-carrier-protein] synthase II
VSTRPRVVVTGMTGVCALGAGWKPVREALRSGRSGITTIPEWETVEGLHTRLGARVTEPLDVARLGRKKLRGMGRVALLAAQAAESALADAALLWDPRVSDGTLGLAFGSTSGSPPSMLAYARAFGVARSTRGVQPTDYLKAMSHTVAANLAQLFEIRGRVIPTCSACTSGSQAIGAGVEAILLGRQPAMLVGGAEELHEIEAAVFDMLLATSTRNDAPARTPRPFDAARDGLVVGEGAGALVLEELGFARARGARIRGEILGWATSCDGVHLTSPDAAGMQRVMELALADAGVAPGEIDYVNAHATATRRGDVAESAATHAVFGARPPVSSLKGHMGHTLGACGALEAWCTLAMMHEGWVAPTLNLEQVDPLCAPLDYVTAAPRAQEIHHAMSNNFAFGGVNTSLVFRRWSEGQ